VEAWLRLNKLFSHRLGVHRSGIPNQQTGSRSCALYPQASHTLVGLGITQRDCRVSDSVGMGWVQVCISDKFPCDTDATILNHSLSPTALNHPKGSEGTRGHQRKSTCIHWHCV
jgi:hypothetical protein